MLENAPRHVVAAGAACAARLVVRTFSRARESSPTNCGAIHELRGSARSAPGYRGSTATLPDGVPSRCELARCEYECNKQQSAVDCSAHARHPGLGQLQERSSEGLKYSPCMVCTCLGMADARAAVRVSLHGQTRRRVGQGRARMCCLFGWV